ncbi:heat shock 70 kDa protein BIP4 [Setaria viridis]|uniref:heat shock 70 kDa protein BIP4 n=1 Tax=Setaria viridis TaxID=4556 RepID=UPI003B3A4848
MFQFCIPSWVAFTDDGATLVGEAASNHAGADPEAVIFGFKRLLGLSTAAGLEHEVQPEQHSRVRMAWKNPRRFRRLEGLQSLRSLTSNHWYEGDNVQTAIKRAPYKITARDFQTPSIHVKSKDGTVKQLSLMKVASMVIAQLKDKAMEYLGGPVDYAVMTIPQHYSGRSRDTAMMAVAVAYGLRTKLREGANALVLHVGGGTADASVVTLMDRSLGIRAYRDDPFLGGDDFDQKVVDYFAELVRMKHGKDVGGDSIALAKLRTACERAKKALSNQEHVQVTVESLFDGVDFSETLSRSKFEELNDDAFRRVVALVRRVMLEAEERRGNIKIDEIILVGTSTMIPKIQRLVKESFNGMEPSIRVKPDEAVALGAVVHAYSVY